MNEKQALEVIRKILDEATKAGIFPNLDASFTAANAFNIIANKILPSD